MAQFYGPFNAGTGASFDETKWRELFGAAITTGVLKGAKVNGSAGNDLAITAAGSGMTVNMGTGEALLYGFFFQNDASAALSLTAADPSLPRIDRAIVKLDLTARTITASIKAGTPAASPSPPALTQTATTWEMSLAQIAVAAAATIISSGNLTDERTYAGAANAVARTGDVMTGPLTINNFLGLNRHLGGVNTPQLFFAPDDAPKDWEIYMDASNGDLVMLQTTDSREVLRWKAAGGVNVASSPVWTAANDGSGSGLDADTLDAVQGSGYALKGTHSAGQPKLSFGTGVPGALDANEVFFQLS